jgi:hypothetical protein
MVVNPPPHKQNLFFLQNSDFGTRGLPKWGLPEKIQKETRLPSGLNNVPGLSSITVKCRGGCCPDFQHRSGVAVHLAAVSGRGSIGRGGSNIIHPFLLAFLSALSIILGGGERKNP